MAKHTTLATIVLLLSNLKFAANIGCDSPQYLEIGKSGIIDCDFHEDFSTIYWYYNLDITDGPATLSYNTEDNEKEGNGLGEFDILPDGSLIINNVTTEHGTRFTVYWYKTDPLNLNRDDVDITTIIRPIPAHPIIDDCGVNQSLCYIPWRQQKSLVCRIQQARPAIPLGWLARTADGGMNLIDNTSFVNQTNSWTSSVSVKHPFTHSSHLALLVCEADDELELLKETQILALVHNKETNTSIFEREEIAVERKNELTIPCNQSDYQLLVWERKPRNGNATKTLLYDVTSVGDVLHASDEYKLQDGSLVITNVNIEHEGLYICTYSDDTGEGVRAFNLSVYVLPVPGYPIIEGCTQDQYCVLVVNTEDRLTCTVKGIRPVVKLEWKVFRKESEGMITFHDQRVNTESNGDTSDVTLTTEFTAKETTEKRLTLECTAVGPNAKYFQHTSRVELLFSGSAQQSSTESVKSSTTSGDPSDNTGALTIIIIVAVVVIFLIGTISVYAVYRKAKKPSTPANIEETFPMVQSTEPSKMTKFISELTLTYENLYSAIKPIPFLQDHCTVHDLFVEGGIEYSLKNQIMKSTWKDLHSYKHIFTHSKLAGNRWIIEGEPGYGKSTLSLQLAYEWCNQVEGSFMREIDVFILIRLRQLKGVSSIYEAIKRFILPRNSHFSIDDIESFIAKSSSVLIILDGFDEYPDSEKRNSDIVDIIQRKMFPESRVVLTTRLSHLPEQYAAQTNRIRLTGFNNDAQERYLQKVVTVNGYKSAENTIKEWLEGNPILKDLCENPLFFVAYAHLSLESDTLKNCTSITTFFRYMITCLHSHMKSKFDDDNVQQFEANENNHQQLDKICFDSLNGHANNPVIERHVLIEQLGKEFVDQYLYIGILRDEDTTVMSNYPGVLASDHVKVLSNVRFYHSLFCEWYAAHHLASSLVDKDDEILEDLDLVRLHYVLRFACGINPKAAKHILEHLQITQDGIESFHLLCILEQFGNVEDIMDNLREVCSASLQLRDHDKKLVQRFVVQLVELAAVKKMTVSTLVLLESFKMVDHNNDTIVLHSEVRLPLLINVKELWFDHKSLQFGEEQLDDIFKFVSRCTDLKEIRFLNSLLPYNLGTYSILKDISSKDIQVLWYPSDVRYLLELDSGYWQKCIVSSRMSEKEYKKVATAFNNLKKDTAVLSRILHTVH